MKIKKILIGWTFGTNAREYGSSQGNIDVLKQNLGNVFGYSCMH